MTRKASGTWSSDKDSVMSAAAVCFYLNKHKNECIVYQITENVNVKKKDTLKKDSLTPKAQQPKIIMIKFKTSIKNIRAYTSHTGLYSGWMMSQKNCLMGMYTCSALEEQKEKACWSTEGYCKLCGLLNKSKSIQLGVKPSVNIIFNRDLVILC